MTRNRCFISFGVTEEEKAEIEDYCQRKRRWKNPSDLARDALWQLMARYPATRKHAQKDAVLKKGSDLSRIDAMSVGGTA